MAPMFGWFSDGKRLRFAVKSRDAIRVSRQRLGKNLEGDVAIEPGVPRQIDFAHTAGPHRGHDRVRAEADAGDESQLART